METQTTKVEFSKLALKNIIDGLELLALKKARESLSIQSFDPSSEEFEELRDLARVIEEASAASHVTLTFTDIPYFADTEHLIGKEYSKSKTGRK